METKDINVMEKLRYILNIVIVTVMFMSVAVNRDAQLFGTPVEEIVKGDNKEVSVVELVSYGADGSTILNSAAVVERVFGYGGKTPVKIHLDGEQITKVELEPNTETPEFLDAVVATGLLTRWNGMSLSEVATSKTDVVSGATMSSSSIIKNVEITAAHSAGVVDSLSTKFSPSLKDIFALVVILFGVVLNFLRVSSKPLKILLFVANVAVLGVWCGSFLSLSLLTAWIANGASLTTAIIPLTLLVVALAMPLLGRKGSYCSHHCPMGAAQELTSLIKVNKLSIPPNVAKKLGRVRDFILGALMLLMWCGVGFSLLDYELFSAFIFKSASLGILIAALLFLILSIFVHRPYCRFVCPTGALFTLIQKNK